MAHTTYNDYEEFQSCGCPSYLYEEGEYYCLGHEFEDMTYDETLSCGCVKRVYMGYEGYEGYKFCSLCPEHKKKHELQQQKDNIRAKELEIACERARKKVIAEMNL